MNQKVKNCLGAFAVGGTTGLLGQFILNQYLAWGLPYAVLLMISTLALIGVALAVLGVYQKVSDIGGMGANVPMCGLSAGIALTTAEAYAQGKSPVKAAIIGLKGPAVTFGSGAITAFICLLAAKLF